MTFELYLDLTWRETRIIINDTHPAWGASDAVMGSTNFIPHMWLPDIQVSKDGGVEVFRVEGVGDSWGHDGCHDEGDDDIDAHNKGDDGSGDVGVY